VRRRENGCIPFLALRSAAFSEPASRHAMSAPEFGRTFDADEFYLRA
jgi:hypothetical protein